MPKTASSLTTKAIRLPDELHAIIKKHAKESSRTLSASASVLIKAGLKAEKGEMYNKPSQFAKGGAK